MSELTAVRGPNYTPTPPSQASANAREFFDKKRQYSTIQGTVLEDFNSGAAEAFSASLVDGFRTSLGPSLVSGIHYQILGKTGNKIEKEVFDQYYGLDGQLTWNDGMTDEQADYLYRNKVKESSLRFRASAAGSDAGTVLISFAGGFFGNLADPVSLAMIAVPGLGVENLTAGIFRQSLASAARGATTRNIGRSILRGAVNAELETLMFEPIIVAGQKQLQSDYGLTDSLMNFAVAPVAGGFFGGVGGAATYRNAKIRNTQLKAAFIDAVTGERSVTRTIMALDPKIAKNKALVDRLDALDQQIGAGPITREQATSLYDTIEELARNNPQEFSIGSLGDDRSRFLESLEQEYHAKREEYRKSYQQLRKSGMDSLSIKEKLKPLNQEVRAARSRLALAQVSDSLNPIQQGRFRPWDPEATSPMPKVVQRAKSSLRNASLSTWLSNSAPARAKDGSLSKGVSESMARIADVMQHLFNREVRYFDDITTFRGMAMMNHPKYLFVNRRGGFSAAPRIIGHEFWHTIKNSDPMLWNYMARFIEENAPAVFDKYYERTSLRQNGIWGSLGTGQRIEESFAEILGDAFNDPKFWKSLNSAVDRGKFDKGVMERLMVFLNDLYVRIKNLMETGRFAGDEDMEKLASSLGEILGERAGKIDTKPRYAERMSDDTDFGEFLTADFRKMVPKLVDRVESLEKTLKKNLENADRKALEDFADIALPNFWTAVYNHGDGNWNMVRAEPIPYNKVKKAVSYLTGIYVNKFKRAYGDQYGDKLATMKYSNAYDRWNDFPVLFVGDPKRGGKPANSETLGQATHVAWFEHKGGFASTTEHRGVETADRYNVDDALLQELNRPMQEFEVADELKATGKNLKWWMGIDVRAELESVNLRMREPTLEPGVRKSLEEQRQLLGYLSENATRQGERLDLISEYYHDTILAKRDAKASHQLTVTNDPSRVVESFFLKRELDSVEANPDKSVKSKGASPEALAEGWTKFINDFLADKKASNEFYDKHGVQSTSFMLMNILAKGLERETDGTVRVDPEFFRKAENNEPNAKIDEYFGIQAAISKRFSDNERVMTLLDEFEEKNYEALKDAAWRDLEEYADAPDFRESDDALSILAQEMFHQRERLAAETNAYTGADEVDPLEVGSREFSIGPDPSLSYKQALQDMLTKSKNMVEAVQENYQSAAQVLSKQIKNRAAKLDTYFTDLVSTTAERSKEFDELIDYVKQTADAKKVARATGRSQPIVEAPKVGADTIERLDLLSKARNKRTLTEEAVTAIFSVDEKGEPVINFNREPLSEFRRFRSVALKRAMGKDLLYTEGSKLNVGEAGDLTVQSILNERLMHSLWRRGRELIAQKMPVEKAMAIMLEDAKIVEAVTVQRELAQVKAENHWGHLAHKGYRWVMTAIDGQMRRGTNLSLGVDTAIKMNVARDMQGFLHTLMAEGVADAWMRGDYTKAVMGHLSGVVSNDPIVVKLAESLRDTQKAIVLRLNEGGAAIRFQDDFVIRQVNNPALIRRAGFQKWMQDTLQWLDVPATMRGLGGVSEAKLQSDGKVEFHPITDIEGYLHKVYEDILAEHPREKVSTFTEQELEEHGGNLAGRYDHHRKLRFKPGEHYNYLKEYGNPNPHHEVFQQLQQLSEAATLLQEFGPNYVKTTNKINETLKRGDANKRQQWTADVTLQKLTGELDHPVESTFSEVGQTVRAVANGAFLGMSGISSMVDVATSFSRARYMGMSYGDFFKDYFKSLAESFARSKNSADRSWFMGTAAGLDAFVGASSRRLTGELPGSNAAKRINDWVFKWNGMNFWNSSAQMAITDTTLKHMARQAQMVRAGKPLTPEFARAIGRFGISPTEFAILSRFSGKEKFFPESIPPQLQAGAEKLRHFIVDTMNESVLMPTSSEEALLTLGTRAGTLEGEAVRTILQYRTFPFALMRKTYRRLFNTIGEEAGQSWSGRFFHKSSLDMYAFLATSFFMGWLSMNIKEIIKGREPLHFTDSDQWKVENVARIIKSSGMLGVINDIATADAFDLLGPALGQLQEVGDSETAYGVASEASELIPGASLPGISAIRKQILATIFQDTGEMHINSAKRMMKARYGQDPLFQ